MKTSSLNHKGGGNAFIGLYGSYAIGEYDSAYLATFLPYTLHIIKGTQNDDGTFDINFGSIARPSIDTLIETREYDYFLWGRDSYYKSCIFSYKIRDLKNTDTLWLMPEPNIVNTNFFVQRFT